MRVSEGGHRIPYDVVERRYFRGIANLFKIYIPLSNEWAVFENSASTPVLIAESINKQIAITNDYFWMKLNSIIEQNG